MVRAGLPVERTSYLPHLDGLRGISVVLVLLFHAWPDSFPGGFIGVDVFFVVSGFLITRLLYSERAGGRLTYGSFLIRRVRRLWPSFALVAILAFAFAWFGLSPAAFDDFARALAAALGLSSNWYFYFTTDYFNEALDSNLLLHTWSLGVEEQFYLVFPLLFLLLGARRRAFALLVGALWLVSFAMSAASAFTGGAQGAFFATHLRVWELATGALLFLLLRDRAAPLSNPLRGTLTLAGLAAILAGTMLLAADMRYPGVLALIPVAGAAAALVFGARAPDGGAFPAAFLSARVLTYTGRISYVLYLTHWPVLQALRTLMFDPGDVEIVLALLVSVILSVLIYHAIEKPVHARRALRSNRALLAVVVPVSALLLAGALLVIQRGGFPERAPPEAALALSAGPDTRPVAMDCGPARETAMRVFGVTAFEGPEAEPLQLCTFGDESRGAPDIILWGDSHMAAAANALAERIIADGRYGVLASRGACPSLLDTAWSPLPPAEAATCAALGEGVARMVESGAVAQLLMVSHWDTYAPQPAGLFGGVRAGKLRMVSAAPGADSGLEVFPRAWTATLARLAPHTRLDVLIDVPTHSFSVPHAVAYRARWPLLPEPGWITAEEQERRRAAYLPLMRDAARAGLVTLHDPLPVFCPEAVCLAEIDGAPLFFDSNHLSAAGADLLLRGLPALGREEPRSQ